MDEQDFRNKAEHALQSLYRKLAKASDKHEFEPDFNAGALTVEFEDSKKKFVVSPNAPVLQIWVSAHSKSFKLDWEPARQAFVWPESEQTLDELMAWAIGQQLAEEIKL